MIRETRGSSVDIRLVHKRIAETCIGPSAMRKQGPAGILRVIRDYLAHIQLSVLSTRPVTNKMYRRFLDRHTRGIIRRLPRGSRYWGTSRKALNLFMRDCLYNTYLSKKYRLARLEHLLEVPLDGIVGKRLYQEDTSGTVPRWRTIIGLTSQESDIYQAFAARLAIGRRTARVHLDLVFWRA